jgi:hypothetical protein
MPPIATKFQYVNSFLFASFSLHVSAPTGHLQVRYTIGYFNGLFLIIYNNYHFYSFLCLHTAIEHGLFFATVKTVLLFSDQQDKHQYLNYFQH